MKSVLHWNLLFVLSLAGTAILQAETTPQGLSTSDWQGIRAAHAAWQHGFRPVEGGWQALNPGQQWTTTFDQRGFLTTPQVGGWQWGLELRGYGVGEIRTKVGSQAPEMKAEGRRLNYQWDAVLQEWWVNDERGLEHGYTISRRPGKGDAALSLSLGTRGSLKPEVLKDGQGVRFLDEGGLAVLNYTGLKVWDADGKVLRSHFEAAEGCELLLKVQDARARYPVTIDPIAQQAYLKPAAVGTAQTGDQFGNKVAISGDTVVISAPYERSSSTGVNSMPNEGASNAGAVYVFVRSSGGVWTQQAFLKPAAVGSSQMNDHFGSAVAISGDTLVVGASGEDSSGTGIDSAPNEGAVDAGAAYVFVRSGSTWSQQAFLKPTNVGTTQAGDAFGTAAAIFGDTLVVGAAGESSNSTGINSSPDEGAANAGAAYVFVRSGSTWTQQAYLKPNSYGTTQVDDGFGGSVSLSGDTVVIGAPGEDSDSLGVNSTITEGAPDAGAAYVFIRSSGGVWTQQAYLKPGAVGTSQALDQFGRSVSISGDSLIVGAPDEQSNTTGVNSTPNDTVGYSGAAYVFIRSGGVWYQQAYLKPHEVGTGSYDDHFGASVSISGDLAVVGVFGEDSSVTGVNGTPDETASGSGAAHVFYRKGFSWSHHSFLKPAAVGNSQEGDQFGWSVAVDGGTVVVGARFEASSSTGIDSTPNESAAQAGAAYIFGLPEVSLIGRGVEIVEGDGTPDVADGTDFGTELVTEGQVTRTFTIKNTGGAPLALTGSPDLVSLTGSGSFTVSSQPVSNSVAAYGGEVTFSITYDPSTASAHQATVKVASDDLDEPLFTFDISGSGVRPGFPDATSYEFAAPEFVSQRVNATAVQPDGKVIVVGSFSRIGTVDRFYIARLNTDGTVDGSFDPKADAEVLCVAVQNDGKILIGGWFTTLQPNGAAAPTPRNRIARLNADGSLDTSFDPNANHGVFCLLPQPDGRILMGGLFTHLNPPGSASPISRQCLARLNANGSLDEDFFPYPNHYVYTMALQPDGKIIVGGQFTSFLPPGAEDHILRKRVARVNADGSIDMTFDPSANDRVESVAVQSDGKILLSGRFTSLQPNEAAGPTNRYGLARVLADGSLDASYDPSPLGSVLSMCLQADGSSIVAGDFYAFSPPGAPEPVTRLKIARLLSDGTLDTGFDPRADALRLKGVSLQKDGRVWVSGEFEGFKPDGIPPIIPRRDLARLVNDPATQSLSAVTDNQVLWTLGGSSPQLSDVRFEISLDGGTTWTFHGRGTPVGATADWQFTGELPRPGGLLRARGRTAGGLYNSSSGVVEQVSSYTLPPIFPEIVVSGNGNEIVNGDESTTGTDLTHFGPLAVMNASTSRTFTLQNTGTAPLNLTGTPQISLSGPGAADFRVLDQPPSVLAVGASSSFTIAFNPKSPGSRLATVNIPNDDPDEAPYTFAISGGGIHPTLMKQTVVFNPPATVYYPAQSVVVLQAYATSGNPVSFSLVSGPATLTANALTITGTGTVKVQASQPAGGGFEAAPPVVRTITVKANPTALTLMNLNQTYSGTPRPIYTLGGGSAAITYKVGTTYVSTAPTAAGSYAVKAVAGGKTVTGTLVVAKAPLFVTPDSKHKFAGKTNPALTFQYSGFVNGESAGAAVSSAPTLSTTATLTSPGGFYPITAKGGTSANYAFIYQTSTLVVESFAGSYEALLIDTTPQPVGKVGITVTTAGTTFTGKLETVADTAPISLVSSALNTDINTETATGTATVTKNGVTYVLGVTLTLEGKFEAVVTRNAAALGASSFGRKLATGNVTYAGAHTAVFEPATPAAATVPAGAGFASMTINSTGTITVLGRLGDSTVISTGLSPDISSNPGYRLFIQPYKTGSTLRTNSYFAGTFQLATHPTLAPRRYLTSASMTWKKTSLAADESYRTNFGPVSTVMMIDPWLPPAASANLSTRLGLTGGSFAMALSPPGSASDAQLPTRLAVNSANAITASAPVTSPMNPLKWTGTFTPATGFYKGSFILTDGLIKRTVPFHTILRQPLNGSDLLVGDGHYLLPGLSGTEKVTGEVIFTRP